MKFTKLAVTFVTVLLAGSAMAGGYTSFEYSDEHNRVTNKDNIKGAVVVGTKTADNWDYSFKMESSQAELGNGSISTGLETRVRKNFPNAIGVFTPWVGVRLGEAIKTDTNFSYYAVEGGVKFPIVGALSGDVGYRYRDAFNQTAFRTDRVYALASYALTKQDSVAVRFSRSYGDEEKDAWRLSYTRNF